MATSYAKKVRNNRVHRTLVVVVLDLYVCSSKKDDFFFCPTKAVMAATIAKHSSRLPGEFVALAYASR